MPLDLTLREHCAGAAMVRIGPFGELEAGVAATTILRHGGATFDAAGDPTMPFDGVIVAMEGNSEASSNFTVDCTVNGTPDTTTTMTMNSAKEYVNFTKANYVSFSAGDTVGMECTADTTSKDFSGALYVVFDVSGN